MSNPPHFGAEMRSGWQGGAVRLHKQTNPKSKAARSNHVVGSVWSSKLKNTFKF